MKLAITADIHLKARKETPERWQALEDILRQLTKNKINNLVIAGDLFDQQMHNYTQFDNLCQQEGFQSISFHILPGNHDHDLNQSSFTAQNIKIYQQPEMVSFEEYELFLVPFISGMTMDDLLIQDKNKFKKNWCLVGHGNWSETFQISNPTEPGVYMPLSRKSLTKFNPKLTLLGHIHKPIDNLDYNLFYPGSPCGLDITETGERSFLVLDLNDLSVKRNVVQGTVLYFDNQLVVYPVEDELQLWQKKVAKLKQEWNLTKNQKKRAVVRVRVTGACFNKRKLKKFFGDELKEFQGWKGDTVDVSKVDSVDSSQELVVLTKRVIDKINGLELNAKESLPSKDQIIYEALKTIYQTQ